jgi:hypothetical protein
MTRRLVVLGAVLAAGATVAVVSMLALLADNELDLRGRR